MNALFLLKNILTAIDFSICALAENLVHPPLYSLLVVREYQPEFVFAENNFVKAASAIAA